ncbi:N-acetyltransferase [Paenibacillus sp. J31TS4]|uniref:GNAT family N-acetyltransferase n=1 Tax=Paenibacillus sp. J31TS4 TaxID=2807195 RepID=UPI001B1EA80F|nr:GNAT family N-acetyltransferase [Paenibacillus sp. J31TS4]GIP38199.1 N-acetyltransferase [Paenibacillus sp. J31TS4]
MIKELMHENEWLDAFPLMNELRTNLNQSTYLDLLRSMSEEGYGEKLLAHIHQYAKLNGCGTVALESGLSRVDAHKFYETKMGYGKLGYSFSKVL